MKRSTAILVSVVALIGLAYLAMTVAGTSPLIVLGWVLNTWRSEGNPAGALVLVENRGGVTTVAGAPADAATPPGQDAEPGGPGSWPSYNRTLTSARYSPWKDINRQTVHGLKVLCTYDTHLRENYETGPLVVEGALIFTTAKDIFSIDPTDCRENWHTHEDYKPSTPLLVNRGAAYLRGRLFRGTLDGRVLAYDASTGKRLWATTIGDPKKVELVDAAPIAWNGLVFIGVGMGDTKGVKGRVYALAADDGHIVWETYTVPRGADDPQRGPQGLMPASAITSWQNGPDVPISGGGSWTSYTLDPASGRLYVPVGNASPDFVESLREGDDLFTGSVLTLDAKTGNYISHFQIAPRDWHDWDASNAPALITTRGGKQVLSFAPKNGYLYAVDLPTNQLLYRKPVTRIENADVPLSTDKEVHFCPGAVGGAEWNGVAYDPQTNLILTGEDEWCTAVRLKSAEQVKTIHAGTSWMGADTANPLDLMGTQDPHSSWAGWLYATDADSGEWKWRIKSNYPILSGITPTAGGLVFFGDMGGNLYAVDAASGQRLWGRKLPGAIGGGVITYMVNGSQKVAVATGLSSFLWPTEQATAQLVILGLDEGSR